MCKSGHDNVSHREAVWDWHGGIMQQPKLGACSVGLCMNSFHPNHPFIINTKGMFKMDTVKCLKAN